MTSRSAFPHTARHTAPHHTLADRAGWRTVAPLVLARTVVPPSCTLEYHRTAGTMPSERPPTKASENRRATKPIMEKRRRARINQCLSELKALILDALNKDPSRHSKLEKADILEMTVKHLQNIQRQQMASAISSDPSVLNKFKAGFNECATEVSRYVNRMEGVDPSLRQRLLSHLTNCLATMNAASNFSQASVGFPTFPAAMMATTPLQSLSVQIPGALTVGLNNNNRDVNNNSSNNNKIFSGLSLIPSRLPNGDLAFLLPSQALTSGNFGIASGSTSTQSLPSSSGPERNSNSSWPPSSPMSPVSSRRSASPATSEHSALSPAGSDGGSDVFVEPYHHNRQRDTVLCTAPRSRPACSSSDSSHNPAGSDGEAVWRPW